MYLKLTCNLKMSVVVINLPFVFSLLEYRYDTVKVRDGEKHYSQLLTPSGGFSGVRFASLEASSNRMWIQFSSDSSINQQGFNLTYRALGKDVVLLKCS